MPIVSFDSLNFSGLAWTFKLLPSKHTERPAYGLLGLHRLNGTNTSLYILAAITKISRMAGSII